MRAITSTAVAIGELLVLLIVHENPSAGVHVPALIEALGVATSWKNQVALPEPRQAGLIPILGPTFSGSSESIVNALKMAYRRQMLKPDQHHVWIVTGSATDDSNKMLIEDAFKAKAGRRPLSVKFDATVQPDRVVSRRSPYMPIGRVAAPIGVLFEGNTQYGRSLKHLLTKENDLSPSDLILLPFPLNISHVRDTAPDEKMGLSQALGLPSRVRPLSMDTPAAPEESDSAAHAVDDLVVAVELGLSSLLQTMRTERVGTVAVMSTDPRDKLFLVRQLAHAAPNVAP